MTDVRHRRRGRPGGARGRTARRRALAAAALLTVLPLVVVAPAAAASPKPAVILTRTTSSVTLADGGGVPVQVASVSLAKGAWTITSNATAVNFGGGDFVRCTLQSAGASLDGGATTFLDDRAAGIINAATITVSGATTVALMCSHDRAAASAGQFYLDPGTTLTAVLGGPISGPGEPPTTKPVVVQTRSTASTTLGESPTTVSTSTLPVGTWAVTATASAVDFGDFDFPLCYLSGGPGVGVLTSDPQSGVEGSDNAVAELTVVGKAVVASGGGTLALVCQSDFTAGVYIDAGATLTATDIPQTKDLVTPTVSNVTLSDTGGVATDVISQKMPAGPWRVRAEVDAGVRNPNNSYGGPSDFVRCTLYAGTVAIDGGSTTSVTDTSNIQEVVNAGAFTATKSWTLRLACSHDQTISTGSHWTVLDGIAQAVKKGPITAS